MVSIELSLGAVQDLAQLDPEQLHRKGFGDEIEVLVDNAVVNDDVLGVARGEQNVGPGPSLK
jgi:hypothetical protein